MLIKQAPVQIKALEEDSSTGQFEAIVSVFGNIDSYGDIVLPGAFTDTLAEWKSSGNPIPVYWSHRMDDPDFNIGSVLEAEETEKGLRVVGVLDLDEGTKAAKVHKLMKERRVTQFSFAYDIIEGAWIEERDNDKSYYELRKLKLYEVGPTPVGANQETELLGVKSAAVQMLERETQRIKAGRVLSSKNEGLLRDAHEQLQAAADQIKNVLSAVETDEEKSDAKSEEPERAKDKEQLIKNFFTESVNYAYDKENDHA